MNTTIITFSDTTKQLIPHFDKMFDSIGIPILTEEIKQLLHTFYNHLTISDNGKGYPENFDIDKQAGLGMVIVQSLVEQLDGTLSIEKNKGTIINISFQ